MNKRYLKYFFLFMNTLIFIHKGDAQIFVQNEKRVNSRYQEYSPAFYESGLVFITSSPEAVPSKLRDEATKKTMTTIVLAKRGDDGKLQKPEPFASELTTRFYDGPLTFSATNETMYFTRTNLKRGTPFVARDGAVKLKIYEAQVKDSLWQNIAELPFNDNNFDCITPTVAIDGKKLYFASNRAGGFGGMDLYVSTLMNGKWSAPVNLGARINTEKDETSPFIHADGTLYFASKGHNGLGGTDIFFAKRDDVGWLKPEALPEPINSKADDYGFIIDLDKKNGYFSSNRGAGVGEDDIWSFYAPNSIDKSLENNVLANNQTEKNTEEKATQEAINVTIDITDSHSEAAIGQTKVKIFDLSLLENPALLTNENGILEGIKTTEGVVIPLSDLPVDSFIANPEGKITQSLKKGNRYLFMFEQNGYAPKYVVKTIFSFDAQVSGFLDKSIGNEAVTNNTKVRINEKPHGSVVEKYTQKFPNKDLFVLPNVYFNYNDAKIRPDARKDLDDWVLFLKENPDIKIELAAHTDARGNADFNLTLSQKRADNLKQYLVKKGIETDRIQAKGYGETALKNGCDDLVGCDEIFHQENRRTEIKILSEKYAAKAQPIMQNTVEMKPQKMIYFVVVGTYARLSAAKTHLEYVKSAGYPEAAIVQNADNKLFAIYVLKTNERIVAEALETAIKTQGKLEVFVKEIN